MLQQSGTTNFICATDASPKYPAQGSCGISGNCTWICDSVGHIGYAQIVAGDGKLVYAVDSNKHAVWEFGGTGFGQYIPDSFFEVGEFTDTIAELSSGGDEETWVRSTTGTLYRQPNNGNWTTITAPSGGAVVSLSVANVNDVWVASTSGLFRYASPGWERHCVTTGCTATQGFTTVAAGGEDLFTDPSGNDEPRGVGEVWGLDSSGNAWRVDRTMGGTDTSISKITGATLTHISVGGMGDVMGINSSGTVFTFQ